MSKQHKNLSSAENEYDEFSERFPYSDEDNFEESDEEENEVDEIEYVLVGKKVVQDDEYDELHESSPYADKDDFEEWGEEENEVDENDFLVEKKVVQKKVFNEKDIVFIKNVDGEINKDVYSDNVLQMSKKIKLEGCADQGKRLEEQDSGLLVAFPVVNCDQSPESINKFLSDAITECTQLPFDSGGSTLVVGYLNSQEKALYINNLGDSRIFINILCRNKKTNELVNQCIVLTEDHDVANKRVMSLLNAKETRKIAGSYLVGSQVKVQTTSSIGDHDCRTNKTPDQTKIDLEEVVQVLFGNDAELKNCEKIQIIAACDGLTEGYDGKNSIGYDYEIKIEGDKHSFVKSNKNELPTFSEVFEYLNVEHFSQKTVAQFIFTQLAEEGVLNHDDEDYKVDKIKEGLNSGDLGKLIEGIFALSDHKKEDQFLKIKNVVFYSCYTAVHNKDFTKLFSAIKKCFGDEDLSWEDLEKSKQIIKGCVSNEEVVNNFYEHYTTKDADINSHLLKDNELLQKIEDCIFAHFLGLLNTTEYLAKALVNNALRSGSKDNVECVVATIEGSFFENIQQTSDSINLLFGVFDGHGNEGEKVSQMCEKVYEKKVLELNNAYEMNYMILLDKVNTCLESKQDILKEVTEDNLDLYMDILCRKLWDPHKDRYLKSTNHEEIQDGIWLLNQIKIINFKKLCKNNDLNFNNSKHDINKVVKNLINQIEISEHCKGATLKVPLKKPKEGAIAIEIAHNIEECTKDLKTLHNKLRHSFSSPDKVRGVRVSSFESFFGEDKNIRI